MGGCEIAFCADVAFGRILPHCICGLAALGDGRRWVCWMGLIAGWRRRRGAERGFWGGGWVGWVCLEIRVARVGRGLGEVVGAVLARRGWVVWTARAMVIGPPFAFRLTVYYPNIMHS